MAKKPDPAEAQVEIKPGLRVAWKNARHGAGIVLDECGEVAPGHVLVARDAPEGEGHPVVMVSFDHLKAVS